MPRQKRKEGMENRVYSYAARVDTPNMPAATDVLIKANDYRNQLVEIELARRKRYNELCEQYSSGYVQLLAELTRLDEEMKLAKADGNKSESKRLGKLFKPLRAEMEKRKAELAEIDTFNVENGENNKLSKVRDKLARANCKVQSGTYQEVEGAAGKRFSGAPPSFRSFNRDGKYSKIALQIGDGGMKTGKIFDSSNRQFWIDPSKLTRLPLGNGQWSEPVEVKNPWRASKFRIGSNPNKTPIWLHFRCKLHRPLPEEAMIKRIWLVPKYIGTHIKWSLQFVLEQPEGSWAKPLSEDGVVTLHMGWSKEADGVVAARWWGSDGYRGSIVIPNDQLDRYAYCSVLQGFIDKEFNEALATIKEAKPKFSEALQLECKFSSQWKNPAKLVKIIATMSEDLQAVGEEFYQTLCKWRAHYKHLYDWLSYQRQSFFDWRKTYYRTVVAEFRERYRTAVFADLNLKKLQELDKTSPDNVKECRRSACLSSLKDELINTMQTQAIAPALNDACGCCGKTIEVVCKECVGKAVRKKKKAVPGECWVCDKRIPDHCEDCDIPRRDNACLNLLRAHWKDTPEKLDAFFHAAGLTSLMTLGRSF